MVKKRINHNKLENYYEEQKKVLDEIEKKNFRIKPLPKYIYKDHEVIKNKLRKKEEMINKEKNKIENIYDDIEIINETKDLKCCLLTSKYLQCRQKVKYKHKNLNKNGENNKRKKNLYFCSTHIKSMAKQDFNVEPRYGYYFESDLYK